MRCNVIKRLISSKITRRFVNNKLLEAKKIKSVLNSPYTNRCFSTNPNTNINNAETTDVTQPTEKNEKHLNLKNRLGQIDSRVWPIALSSFFMGTGMGVVIPIMPSFTASIGLTTAQYGLVISVMGITRLLFNVPAAWASDKFGRRPLLLVGPVLSAFGMALTATANSMNALMAFRFVMGAGGSIQMAGAQDYLSDISTPANRARTMAPLMAAFSAGASMGPALGGVLADNFGFRPAFVVVSCAFAVVAINNYLRCPETRTFTMESTPSLIHEFRRTMNQWVPIVSSLDNRCICLVHSGFWFSQSGCVYALMPLYATNCLEMPMSQIGVIFAMMSVINVFGAQPFAYLADRFGRKKLIFPAILLISASTPMIQFCSTAQQLTCLMAVCSLGSCMLGSAPVAYIADKNPPETRSQALALLRSSGDFGLMLGAGSLGYIAHVIDYGAAFNTGALVMFSAGLHFMLRAKESVHLNK